LPEGFELDEPVATVSLGQEKEVGPGQSGLLPGFELDRDETGSTELPAGFELDKQEPAITELPEGFEVEPEGVTDYRNKLAIAMSDAGGVLERDPGFWERTGRSLLATAFLNAPAAIPSYIGRKAHESVLEDAENMTPEERENAALKVATAFLFSKQMEPAESQHFTDYLADFLGMGVGFLGPGPGKLSAVTRGLRLFSKAAGFILPANFLAKLGPRIFGKVIGGVRNVFGRAALHGAAAGLTYGAAELPAITPEEGGKEIAKNKAAQMLDTIFGFTLFSTATAGVFKFLPKAFITKMKWTEADFKLKFPDMARKVAKDMASEAEKEVVYNVYDYLAAREQPMPPFQAGEKGLGLEAVRNRAWVNFVPVLRDIVSGARKVEIKGGEYAKEIRAQVEGGGGEQAMGPGEEGRLRVRNLEEKRLEAKPGEPVPEAGGEVRPEAGKVEIDQPAIDVPGPSRVPAGPEVVPDSMANPVTVVNPLTKITFKAERPYDLWEFVRGNKIKAYDKGMLSEEIYGQHGRGGLHPSLRGGPDARRADLVAQEAVAEGLLPPGSNDMDMIAALKTIQLQRSGMRSQETGLRQVLRNQSLDNKDLALDTEWNDLQWQLKKQGGDGAPGVNLWYGDKVKIGGREYEVTGDRFDINNEYVDMLYMENADTGRRIWLGKKEVYWDKGSFVAGEARESGVMGFPDKIRNPKKFSQQELTGEGVFNLYGEKVPDGEAVQRAIESDRLRKYNLENMARDLPGMPPRVSPEKEVGFPDKITEGFEPVRNERGEILEPAKRPPPVIPVEDDPAHSDLPLALDGPEALQLAKELVGGYKNIEVRKRLPGAKGTFDPKTGKMKIAADVFSPVPKEKRIELANEAMQWAMEKAEGDMQSVESLTKQRFRYLYEKEFDRVLATGESVEGALRTIMHEAGHAVDWAPQKIVAGRGNILGRIASFERYFQEQLAKFPRDQADLISKEERGKMYKLAKQIGKKDKAAVKAAYDNLLSEELARRGLVTEKQIRAELEPLAAWWHSLEGGSELRAPTGAPAPGEPAAPIPYFRQSHELYAEAMSVLLNNPQALKKRAPLFYSMFFNWLENKPEFRRLYTKMQETLKTGERDPARRRILREEMLEANRKAAETEYLRKDISSREMRDAWIYTVDRVFGPAQLRYTAITDPKERTRAFGQLSNVLYQPGSTAELIHDQIVNSVVPILKEKGLGFTEDLGEYLFHNRVVYGDRMGIGNPWNYDVKTSRQALEHMRKTYGPDKFSALEESSLWLRNIYEKEVLDLAKEYKIFSDKQMDMLMENIFYATFAVSKNEALPGQNVLQNEMARQYGDMVTSHLFKQYGTMKPVKSPAVATLQKMVAIMRMVVKEHAKYEMIKELKRPDVEEKFGIEWEPAPKVYDGKRRVVKMVENERIGTLLILHEGEVEGWYGPRVMVDAFNRQSPIEIMTIARSMSTGNGILKAVFTQANPFWWLFGFTYDVQDFNRKMPGTWKDVRNWIPFTGGTFGRYMVASMKDSWSTIVGRPTATAAEALRRGTLISKVEGYRGEHQDDEWSRVLKSRGLFNAVSDKELGRLDKIVDGWHRFMELGQFFERTVKIAGFRYLDDKFPTMPREEKNLIIRQWSGSPDFLEKAGANWLIDSVALFYNPAKEGYRSEKRAWLGGGGVKGRPMEMAINTLRLTILPTLGLTLLANLSRLTGKRGDERSDFEQIYQDSIGERDRLSYRCIPLGWIDKVNHKGMYLRLPMPENARIISATCQTLVQAALNKEMTDPKAVLDYAGRQLPTSNPIIKCAMNWLTYAGGGNPFDVFRNRGVLTDDEARLRGIIGLKAMAKDTWNNTLGSLLGRAESRDPNAPPYTIEEKILKLPIISSAIGRWIKISDAGYRERLVKAGEPIAVKMAKARYENMNTVNNVMRGQPLTTDEVAKLSEGKALQMYHPHDTLSPELEVKRYYYVNFKNELKQAFQAKYYTIDLRTLTKRYPKAVKSAVIRELLRE